MIEGQLWLTWALILLDGKRKSNTLLSNSEKFFPEAPVWTMYLFIIYFTFPWLFFIIIYRGVVCTSIDVDGDREAIQMVFENDLVIRWKSSFLSLRYGSGTDLRWNSSNGNSKNSFVCCCQPLRAWRVLMHASLWCTVTSTMHIIAGAFEAIKLMCCAKFVLAVICTPVPVDQEPSETRLLLCVSLY